MRTLLLDLVEKVQRRYLESNFFAIAPLKVTFSIESKFIKVVYGPSYNNMGTRREYKIVEQTRHSGTTICLGETTFNCEFMVFMIDKKMKM